MTLYTTRVIFDIHVDGIEDHTAALVRSSVGDLSRFVGQLATPPPPIYHGDNGLVGEAVSSAPHWRSQTRQLLLSGFESVHRPSLDYSQK